MITDVPTADDFRIHGLRYLNLGWGQSIRIGVEMLEFEEYGWDDDDTEIKRDFVKRAEPEFATALALVVQGSEFLLKSKICAVSPWLLLSRGSEEWPKQCDRKDTPFADFHTIDAQELLKVHDTFCQPRLSDEFQSVFRDLRRKRNAMMHTVDLRVQPTLAEIIERTLFVAEELTKPQTWPQERSVFLENSRDSAIDADAAGFVLTREFQVVINLLPPAKLLRYFGLQPKVRRYICPTCRHCYRDSELEPRTAVLQPNAPTSTAVYCFVCRSTSLAVRKPCSDGECKGNVIDVDHEECLTCGGDNSR